MFAIKKSQTILSAFPSIALESAYYTKNHRNNHKHENTLYFVQQSPKEFGSSIFDFDPTYRYALAIRLDGEFSFFGIFQIILHLFWHFEYWREWSISVHFIRFIYQSSDFEGDSQVFESKFEACGENLKTYRRVNKKTPIKLFSIKVLSLEITRKM